MSGYSGLTMIPGRQVPSVSDAGRTPAPGRLELVRALVNSVDIESESDELTSPPALEAWLASRGLLANGRHPSAEDLADVIELRETLRDVLEGNAGDPVAPRVSRRLDAILVRVPLHLQIANGARLQLAPGRDQPAIAGLVAAIGEAIYEATLTGSWSRLKVCANDSCRWVFYDASRNHSGTWCTMSVCGNRMKGRKFRRRHPAHTPTAG